MLVDLRRVIFLQVAEETMMVAAHDDRVLVVSAPGNVMLFESQRIGLITKEAFGVEHSKTLPSVLLSGFTANFDVLVFRTLILAIRTFWFVGHGFDFLQMTMR